MGHLYVGTSGWCGLHPRDFARHYDVVSSSTSRSSELPEVEFNWTFHERDNNEDHYRKVRAELGL